MKHLVTDEMVSEYIDCVSKGIPPGNVFPARMSECDFTPSQRLRINEARAANKLYQKASSIPKVASSMVEPPKGQLPLKPTAIPKPAVAKKQTKLQKLLSQQSGRCFYCRELLKEEDASIDHLRPKSLCLWGGNGLYNCVACHKHQNAAFGNMDLKEKIAFVLSSAGSFKCVCK